MILHALNDYYGRLIDGGKEGIPRFGFSSQGVHFSLVLNRDGELLQVRDLRDEKRPKRMIVPEAAIRAINIAANFLWDNCGYVLGADAKGKPDRALETFQAFRSLHHTIGDCLDDEGMKTLLLFLDGWKPEDSRKLPYWDEISSGANLVFELDGQNQLMHERLRIIDAWLEYRKRKARELPLGQCLVTGRREPIPLLHNKSKGVRGAQSTGAALVSFNLKAFTSYGKGQNLNAPVGDTVAFNYTTALNHLLAPASRQKVQIGNATTIFWTERESPIEGFMGMILNPKEDEGDLKEIRDYLEALRDGKMPGGLGDPELQFYILGLSPNASRLSVRFWYVSSVFEMSSRIGQHFRDLSIVKSFSTDPDFPAIWQLLRETALQGKSENIQPLLAGAMMRAILSGSAYPKALLLQVLSRIRADHNINYPRAAIIKACIVRERRINHLPEEVGMTLDRRSVNVGYRLGRLFAALEKAQRDAIPGAGATIKDRYFGSASATPRTVFPQLLRLAQHHISKAEFGRFSDVAIEEIMQGVQEFPAFLSLDDQGMFAIGYYHQRNAFRPKSQDQKEVQNG